MPKQKVRPILSTYNDAGQEILDPDPLSLPVKFQRPLSVAQELSRLMRDPGFRAYLDDHDQESFEDADDFNIEDDPVDPATPYEDHFEPEQPGIAARIGEIQSGIVKDIPIETKLKDREIIGERKRSKRSDDRAHKEFVHSSRRVLRSKATSDSGTEVDGRDNGSEDLEKEPRSNARART